MDNGKLAKNTTLFSIALATQKALSFIYFIFFARIIGVENTGKLSFALSFTTIFAMLMDFGLSQVLIRESARDKKAAEKYLANTLGWKLLLSLIIYGAIILIINWLNYPPLTKQLVYIAAIVMLIDSFALSFFSILRGYQDLKFESLGVILNQGAVMICGFIVLWLNWGLVALISVYLIGSGLNLLISYSALKFKYRLPFRINFNFQFFKTMLVLALPFGIAAFFIRIYSTIDTILLSKLADDRAVGLYSVAYKITFALQFIGVAFSASIYPAFCHYYANAKELLSKTFTKSLHYLLLLSLPISVGAILMADKLIGPIFGAEYAPAGPALQLMMAALVFIFLSFPVGALLNACNKQTRNTINLAIVAIFSVIANLILIPLWSYVGSALATLLSYGLLFFLGISVARQIVNYNKKYLWLILLKVSTSGLVMALIVGLLKQRLHFIFVIPIGALVYLIMIVLTQAITKADISQLKILLKK